MGAACACGLDVKALGQGRTCKDGSCYAIWLLTGRPGQADGAGDLCVEGWPSVDGDLPQL